MKTILCIFAVEEMKLLHGKNAINRRQVHVCLSVPLYIFSLQLLCRQTRQNKLSYSSSTQQSSSISWTPLAPFYRENVVLMVTFNKPNPTVIARGRVSLSSVASSLIYLDSQESHCWWLCVFETEHHFTFYGRCLQFMSDKDHLYYFQ